MADRRPATRSVVGDAALPTPRPGEVVLAMGGRPLARLAAEGLVPKNRKIGGLRGHPIKRGDGWFLLTYDPFTPLVEIERKPDIEWDVRLADRLSRTGSVKPEVGDYGWVDDLDVICRYVRQEYARRLSLGLTPRQARVKVALDLETEGLYPWYPDKQIVTVQLTAARGYSDVCYVLGASPARIARVVEQLTWLLNTEMVRLVGANLKFDLVWLIEKWGVACTNFAFDTLLGGSMVDENRSNSLKLHARVYSTMGGYEDAFEAKYDKGAMGKVPRDDPDFLTYAGGDTDACYQVEEPIRAALVADNPTRDGRPAKRSISNLYAVIIHPACRAFEKIERRGLLIDKDRFDKFGHVVQEDISAAGEKVIDLLPAGLKAKYKDRIEDFRATPGKSPVTARMIHDFMFSPMGLNLKPMMKTEKSGEPSTARAHLRMFAEHETGGPFAAATEELAAATKMFGTYYVGFLNHLRPDGRFHPSYMLFRAGGDDADDEQGGGTVCVTADTLFLTSRGQVPFSEVRVGDSVVTHEGRARRVSALVDNGVRPTFRVRLTNGLAVTTTGNHPFLTDAGWRCADQLTPGERVVVYARPEEWRDVAGWPYEVSSWGRVRRIGGVPLALQAKGRWGHLKITMVRDDRKRTSGNRLDTPVHRLVAKAFVDNPDGLPEVRHKNGIAWDNSAHNLGWGSALDNRRDMARHCTGQGAHGNQQKLTWDDVHWLRRGTTLSDAAAGKALGVSRELVREVRAHRRWPEKEPVEDRASFWLEQVVEVSLAGEQPTFGVTVEGDHSHVTDGVVTHNTGRTSAVDPAVQTIPKYNKWAKLMRAAFVAPPGQQILSCDYSQGELRVVACWAHVTKMIAAYQAGHDLHSLTTAEVAGMKLDEYMALEKTDPALWDSMRRNGKVMNFGLIYGMSAGGFQQYAWANYKIKLTDEEAEFQRTRFFQAYPELLTYHDRQEGDTRAHGFVRSPLGRLRRLPLIHSPESKARGSARRQAINSPIQSTLNELCLWAIAEMDRRYPELDLVGMTHDNVLSYVPEGEAEVWAARSTELMGNLPIRETFGWDHQLDFPADAEIGYDLGSLKKLKKAA